MHTTHGMRGRRRRRSPEEIGRLLRRLERGGLSPAAFAEREGVPLSTVYAWRRKAWRREPPEVVEIPWPPSGGEAHLTVCWPGGLRMLVPYDAPVAAVVAVARALEGRT
jgi:hypothetical protein